MSENRERAAASLVQRFSKFLWLRDRLRFCKIFVGCGGGGGSCGRVGGQK